MMSPPSYDELLTWPARLVADMRIVVAVLGDVRELKNSGPSQ